MRLLDLKLQLDEATLDIGTLTQYPEADPSLAKQLTKYKRVNIFLNKIIGNKDFQLDDGSMVKVKKSEAKRLLDLFTASTPPAGSLQIATDRGNFILSKFFKSEDIGGKGGGAGSEKISNLGNVSEGIIGAALFAKLKARTNNTIEVIDASDIWNVLDSLNVQRIVTPTGKEAEWGEYGVAIKDSGRKVVNDTIKYTLKLSRPHYEDLMDKKKRPLMQHLATNAAEYANSPEAQDYCEYFYLNGKPDVIHVISDGVTESTTRKTDVEVVITDPKTGKETHQRLNISLKAGSGQLGQVGGGGKGSDPFDAQKSLWNAFGIDVESSRKEFTSLLTKKGLPAAVETVFRDATTFLQDLLSGSYDDAEYLFLRDLVKGIDYYATLNDPTIILVDIEHGYDILSFTVLEDRLKDIDLDAEYSETAKNPQIDIIDRVSGEILIRFRTKRETKKGGGDYYRYYVFKGPLLKKLTSIKR